MILDSFNSPLRIASLAIPSVPGRIGLTLCPGKRQTGALSGEWARDLETDLEAIAAWGATAIVTLLESHEFASLGVPEFSEQIPMKFAWCWLPIPDGGVPDDAFEQAWKVQGPEIRSRLEQGQSVLIHCRAGLGRTGTVAARLLIEFGLEPRAAIGAVRAARPGAIETGAQERYVLALGNLK